MPFVDAHLDLAWNAVQGGRDLRQAVTEIRRAEVGQEGPGRGQGTVALPELRRAPVVVAIATLIARSTGTPVDGLDYATITEAAAAAREQLAYYRWLEQEGLATVLETAEALDRHVAARRRGPDGPLGIVVSLEGADPIADPDELDRWYGSGLRIVGLSHYGPGHYAGGTGTELGIGPLGRELLAAMAARGMPLDLAHLTDIGLAEALELYDGVVLSSHANCRALVPGQRQLSDAQITAIAERDGVIGIAFDCWMLDPDWIHGQKTNTVTLAAVVDHIDHVCQLVGTSRHVGIGSDLDGGFGREQSPADLDTIAGFAGVPPLLAQRGYGEADIERIMQGNWLRLLSRCL